MQKVKFKENVTNQESVNFQVTTPHMQVHTTILLESTNRKINAYVVILYLLLIFVVRWGGYEIKMA